MFAGDWTERVKICVDFIYVKVKNRQNQPLVLEFMLAVTFRVEGEEATGRDTKGACYAHGSVGSVIIHWALYLYFIYFSLYMLNFNNMFFEGKTHTQKYVSFKQPKIVVRLK